MAILKLFHVFVVFLWIGSLLMLSRFLAYQAKEPPEVQLKIGRMLKRFYLAVDLPSMILSVGLGFTSIFIKGVDWRAPWLHMKLLFVFFLIVFDLIIGKLTLKHSLTPIVGKGRRFKIVHSASGLCFIGVLVAIYIFKAKVS